MSKITRRAAAAGAVATGIAAPSVLRAQGAFPNIGQPLKFVVGFPAGAIVGVAELAWDVEDLPAHRALEAT